MKKDLLVPDIGDFENVEIIELLVKQGQKISINDPIVTLESDKSSVEVPSTEEGVIESISVKIGDKVSKGDKLVSISINGGSEKIEEFIEIFPENLNTTLTMLAHTLINPSLSPHRTYTHIYAY